MMLNHDDVHAYSDDVYCDVYDDDVYNMLYDGSLQKSRPHKLLSARRDF